MVFKKCNIWAAALFTGIFAVAFYLAVNNSLAFHLAVNNSLCPNSGYWLCRMYHFIGFYKVAWKLKHLTFHSNLGHLPSDKKNTRFRHGVLWMAPFLSGGGYCSEALSYILPLESSGLVPYLSIEHHGDFASEIFWRGLPATTKSSLIKMYRPGHPLNDTVVICHSEPGAWYPSLFETHTCPPTGYSEPFYVIGRTMFETDRVNAEHVKRCNLMDEIWVPSEFNIKTFASSGVDPSKLVKVVQTVDVNFFNPRKVLPLRLPTSGRIFGPKTNKDGNSGATNFFVFLSIFKWEYRKGWDVLMKAYLTEFSANEKVALHILTKAYHTGSVYKDDITAYVEKADLKEPENGWPIVHVHDKHIPQSELPSVFKAGNAFVLPSRGEGWGRPHVEAMSMGLPVIATNWSGMTEYMTESNSYPLHVQELLEVEDGPFKGHLWAEPSVEHLRLLMRHIFTYRSEAKAKGWLARQTMVERFSPKIVTQQIFQHLQRIQKTLAAT